jgi:hypothetical protein
LLGKALAEAENIQFPLLWLDEKESLKTTSLVLHFLVVEALPKAAVFISVGCIYGDGAS